MKVWFVAVLLGVLVAWTPAARAQSFEDGLEAALVNWRAATWYARTGNSDVAGLETEEFRSKWAALQARFVEPPPPFAHDAQWNATLEKIALLAGDAAKALEGGDNASAGKALRGIGETLAAVRQRNGVTGFSDYVSRYRDVIDALGALSLDDKLDAKRLGSLRAITARAAEAVTAMERNAPERWRGDNMFETLLKQNRDSVAALAAALSRADPPSTLEIVGLIRVVRSDYNLLFLQFGAAPSLRSGLQFAAAPAEFDVGLECL